MAPKSEPYWDSRGVPELPTDVLKLSKFERKTWRARYVQDLYIPDGLTKKQEKEWRKKNTVKVLTGNEPKGTGVPLRKVPSRLQSASNAQSISATKPQPAHALGFTRLCIAPKKQWHNADGSVWQPGQHKTHAGGIDDQSSNRQPKNTTSQPISPQPLGFTRLCVPASKQWHDVNGTVWQPSKSVLSAGGNDDSTSSQQQHDTFTQPPPKRQKTLHVIYPPATERRLSSIPNNLGWSNGEEAFKRMSALVDGSDSELSDDDSTDSSDDEVAARPVVQGSVSESFADQINEGSVTTTKVSPNSQLQATLDEAIEESQPTDEHGSPSPLDARSDLAFPPKFHKSQDGDTQIQDAATISSDALSDDGAEKHGRVEIPSPSLHAVPMTQAARHFNLDAQESTQDMYEAVTEVLEDVCSSTRALPSSTSTKSPIRKSPLITRSSSRHSELVLEPITLQESPTALPDDGSASSDSNSMAEVGEEDGEQDIEGVSTGSVSDDEGNIVVALRVASRDHAEDEDEDMKDSQPERESSLDSKLSSSILEELSHSPTPPPPVVEPQTSVTTRRISKRTRASQAEVPQVPPASPKVIVKRVPDARRKITGMTSKHFSKSKRSEDPLTMPRQSKRTAAQRDSRVENPVQSRMSSQYDATWVHADDEFDGDEIQVASRRRSTRQETPSDETHGGEQNNLPEVKPWPAMLSSQRIAYVDLTGQRSELTGQLETRPIAYVDLTGETLSLPKPVPRSSPPKASDDPLDHLEKLLKPPNFAKSKEAVPASSAIEEHETSTSAKGVKEEQESKESAPITPSRPKRAPKKTTGTKSPHFITDRVDLYNTTSSSRRAPAGTSIVPVPALTASAFGIIQEKLWDEPFWLLIAVTFLNKTTGRAAVPIFWKVKKLFPTPEQLAEANPEALLEMVKTLGLQNARSKRLITMAKAWVASPPVKGMTYRTLNYPLQGDGRAREVPDIAEEDIEVCKGSIEIGHMPGCGAYAYDSWRVFCRDVFRGVAKDYDGKGAEGGNKGGFEAEWKRVLPGDKELRACLRWMWMREGWVWNPLSGEKRLASPEELELAKNGEMCIEDEGERKFAKQAVGVDVSSPVKGEDAGDVLY